MLILKSINNINFLLNELAHFMNNLQLVIQLSYHWAAKIKIWSLHKSLIRIIYAVILEGSYKAMY